MLSTQQKLGVAVSAILLITFSLFMSQSHRSQAQAPTPVKTAVAKTQTTTLTLSPDAIKHSQLEMLTAGPQVLNRTLELPGQIALNQHKVQAVVTKLPGVVIQTHHHVGEKVRQGEVMAIIESRELADLKLTYLNSRKATQQAEEMLARETRLSQNIQRMISRLRQGGDPGALLNELQNLQIGEAKARLMTDLGNLRLAYSTWQREDKLAQQQLASEQDVQQALRDYENAKVRYLAGFEEITWQREQLLLNAQQAHILARTETESAAAKLQVFGLSPAQIIQIQATGLPRYEIRAPLSGTIVERPITEGQGVLAENTLFVVADLSEVWAEIQVYEKDLNKVKLGLSVQVKAPDLEQSMAGSIRHIKPLVDNNSRAAEAHAHLPNPQGLWRPGMYVTVAVSTDKRRVPLAVHQSAIQTVDGQEVVFSRQGNRFELHPVTLGERDGTWVEVRAGLVPGAAYVGTNSFVVKSEFAKQAEGAE